MVGSFGKPGLKAMLLGAVFAVTVSAWAALAADVPDEGSPLTAISDFNRDGMADIARVTLPADDSSGQDSLTVLLGQKNGGFRQGTVRTMPGSEPRSIVTGDFNRDGVPDLMVGEDNGDLLLFLGDGAGGFAPATDVAHLDSVVSIAVADFNHDGVQDIAVSDWRASSVTVLLGTEGGTFQRGWSFPLRMRATDPFLSAADFNGDGIPDLAVVYENDDEDSYDVMLGNGNGTFTIAPERGFVRDPNSHCAT